jgi:hypothetical protein
MLSCDIRNRNLLIFVLLVNNFVGVGLGLAINILKPDPNDNDNVVDILLIIRGCHILTLDTCMAYQFQHILKFFINRKREYIISTNKKEVKPEENVFSRENRIVINTVWILYILNVIYKLPITLFWYYYRSSLYKGKNVTIDFIYALIFYTLIPILNVLNCFAFLYLFYF